MPPLVIACGDHAGIGPEVTLKAVAAERLHPDSPGFVLIGDVPELERLRALLKLDLDWSAYPCATPGFVPLGHASERSVQAASPVWVLHLDTAPIPVGPGSRPVSPTAVAALAYLRRAAEGCLRGEFSGLVTAPVSKEAIHRSGTPFVGQTEFLAELSNTRDVTMMLLGDDDRGRWLRVALVTTHLPLRAVADSITASGVTRAIRQTSDAIRKLGLPRARIGVAGLNPHAGEGGMLGHEEAEVILPGIVAARESGIDVRGPVPGDTLFHQALRGDFEAVVAMYHDQGLAPLKLVAFDRGVNWSLGLPFTRTSPDHGTAFDIAGRGLADPASMQSAIRMAASLAGK